MDWKDAKALSISWQRDARLNELPKQIFMLLPMLLLPVLLLYVLYHVLVLVWGRKANFCRHFGSSYLET